MERTKAETKKANKERKKALKDKKKIDAAYWQGKFNQTERTLAESRYQTGILQRECDSLRAQKAAADRGEPRAGMVEQDSTLAGVQFQLAQWRRRAQEITAQANEDAASFRKMTQDREGDAKVLRAECASVRAHLDIALKLLEDRTRELKGVQPFLTQMDSVSSAEAMGLVQALNADIFQLAAFMSDSFSAATSETPAETPTNEDPKGAHRIKGHLGDQLMVSLASWPHTDDPTVLQMALQCYLVQMSRHITSDWTFDGSSPVLAKLYEQVRNSEDQAVAGRWRALSRSHLRHLSAGGKDALPHIRKFICSGLADVLISAKCQLSPSGVVEALSGKFGDRIYAIIDAALNINRILGEEITSGDFEIVTCPGGVTFDPSWMEDVASENSYDEKSIVLCTTEMGLKRESREVKGGEIAKEFVLLLKPKVALESVLAQISSAEETRPEYTIEEWDETM